MAVEALGEILDSDASVLEIGAGPGTLTIPLSRKVKRIVVVESSGAAVASLSKNLAECRVVNVEVMNRNWLEMGGREIRDDFDLVVCSHFLWQMKDLKRHLAKMEEASRGHCAVIQPAGRDSMVKEMWTEITGKRYTGEFDPDADHWFILSPAGSCSPHRVMLHARDRRYIPGSGMGVENFGIGDGFYRNCTDTCLYSWQKTYRARLNRIAANAARTRIPANVKSVAMRNSNSVVCNSVSSSCISIGVSATDCEAVF